MFAKMFSLYTCTPNVYVVKGVTVYDCLPRVLALLRVLHFFVELTNMVFSNYVKHRILYYQWLRKNYEGIACCILKKGTKSLKLACTRI